MYLNRFLGDGGPSDAPIVYYDPYGNVIDPYLIHPDQEAGGGANQGAGGWSLMQPDQEAGGGANQVQPLPPAVQAAAAAQGVTNPVVMYSQENQNLVLAPPVVTYEEAPAPLAPYAPIPSYETPAPLYPAPATPSPTVVSIMPVTNVPPVIEPAPMTYAPAPPPATLPNDFTVPTTPVVVAVPYQPAYTPNTGGGDETNQGMEIPGYPRPAAQKSNFGLLAALVAAASLLSN